MIRVLAILTLSVVAVAVAGARAQTLREAVECLLAFEPEWERARTEGLGAADGIPPARDGLLAEIGLEQAALGGRVDHPGPEDTGASGDLLDQQLNVSLRRLLAEDQEAAADRGEIPEHRQAMRVFLEKSLIEARVVGLVESYLELLRLERRIQEGERSIAWQDAVRGRLSAGEFSGLSGTGRGALEDYSGRVLAALKGLRLAQAAAQARFQRLVGRPPARLEQPPLPMIPEDRGAVDLSGNWNYLASVEGVRAADGRSEKAARARLPGVFFDVSHARAEELAGEASSEVETSALLALSWEFGRGGSFGAAERKAAWQVAKAEELQRAADLQRQYALSLLWRERQASLAAVNSLRIQTGLLGSVAGDREAQLLAGRRGLAAVLSLQEKIDGLRSRRIDAESLLMVNGFRILGVQGRCVEFVMGEGYLERRVGGGPSLALRDDSCRQGNGDVAMLQGLSREGCGEAGLALEDERREGVLRALIPQPSEGKAPQGEPGCGPCEGGAGAR